MIANSSCKLFVDNGLESGIFDRPKCSFTLIHDRIVWDASKIELNYRGHGLDQIWNKSYCMNHTVGFIRYAAYQSMSTNSLHPYSKNKATVQKDKNYIYCYFDRIHFWMNRVRTFRLFIVAEFKIKWLNRQFAMRFLTQRSDLIQIRSV